MTFKTVPQSGREIDCLKISFIVFITYLLKKCQPFKNKGAFLRAF